MSDINSVNITGNLGYDPKLSLEETVPRANMKVCINNTIRNKDKNGEITYENRAVWVDVVAFHSAAKKCKYLEKGQKVTIKGRLNQKMFTDTGENRLEIVGTNIIPGQKSSKE